MSKLINFNEDYKIKSSVISFGNYDGLHIGHKKILNHLKSKSKYYNVSSVVIIFNPHTASVLNNKKHVITPHSVKIELLNKIPSSLFLLCLL